MSTTIPRLMSKMAAAKAVGMDRQTLEANFVKPKRVTLYRFGLRGFRIDVDELLEAMKTYGREEAEEEVAANETEPLATTLTTTAPEVGGGARAS